MYRFGEDVLETMAAWTDTLLQERVPDAHDVSILDLGTGNGSFLFRMAAMGYRDLHGSDYSAQSINLAKAIAKRRDVSNIKWIQDDLLDTRISSRYTSGLPTREHLAQAIKEKGSKSKPSRNCTDGLS